MIKDIQLLLAERYYQFIINFSNTEFFLSPCRWVGNIKTDLEETGWGGMDWVSLAQDRDKWRAVVNVIMNLQVP
jgi:hypothetical protein